MKNDIDKLNQENKTLLQTKNEYYSSIKIIHHVFGRGDSFLDNQIDLIQTKIQLNNIKLIKLKKELHHD